MSEAGDPRSKRLLASPGVPYGRPPMRSWHVRSVPANEDHTAAEALSPGQRPWSGSRHRASLRAPGRRASSRRSVRVPCEDITTYRARLTSGVRAVPSPAGGNCDGAPGLASIRRTRCWCGEYSRSDDAVLGDAVSGRGARCTARHRRVADRRGAESQPVPSPLECSAQVVDKVAQRSVRRSSSVDVHVADYVLGVLDSAQ